MNKLKEAVVKVNCALQLKRRIVGVKFLFTEDEFNEVKAKKIDGKMHYCVMIKSAMAGNNIKISKEKFSCIGSARALGMIEPEEDFKSGCYYDRQGLYQDLVTAKSIRNNMTLCQHKAFGVEIRPLENFTTKPDIVIIVTNPYNAMRIVQGYTYIYGINSSYKMSGNQAICSECTAYPFESNNMNISMLCGGTRFNASWAIDELGIGLPFNRFYCVVEGVYNTINPIERNPNKFKIEEKLKENQIKDLVIEYNKNY